MTDDLRAFDLSAAPAAAPHKEEITRRELEILNHACAVLLATHPRRYPQREIMTLQAKLLRGWQSLANPVADVIKGMDMIEAIKTLRQLNNMSLKEAKDLVQHLESQGHWTRPNRTALKEV